MPSFWAKDDITGSLETLEDKIDRQLQSVFEYTARDMENYAKSNAPWTDQTSNARNGLKAITEFIPRSKYQVTLTHGVPYGIWLEVRFSGRYAIIDPTIQREIPLLSSMLDGLLGDLK